VPWRLRGKTRSGAGEAARGVRAGLRCVRARGHGVCALLAGVVSCLGRAVEWRLGGAIRARG
jgi:hypothetical protein